MKIGMGKLRGIKHRSFQRSESSSFPACREVFPVALFLDKEDEGVW